MKACLASFVASRQQSWDKVYQFIMSRPRCNRSTSPKLLNLLRAAKLYEITPRIIHSTSFINKTPHNVSSLVQFSPCSISCSQDIIDRTLLLFNHTNKQNGAASHTPQLFLPQNATRPADQEKCLPAPTSRNLGNPSWGYRMWDCAPDARSPCLG